MITVLSAAVYGQGDAPIASRIGRSAGGEAATAETDPAHAQLAGALGVSTAELADGHKDAKVHLSFQTTVHSV